MKSLILLCVVLVSGHCFPTSGETWSLFKRVFKKDYSSNEEETNRFVKILV